VAVRGLIVVIGTVRAFQMRKYEKRTEMLTFDDRRNTGSRAIQIGAMLYAGRARPLVLRHAARQRRCRRAHDLRRRDDRLHRRRRGRNYGRPWIIQSHPAGLRTDVAALALHGNPITSACRAAGAVLHRLKHINLSLHSIFVKALTSSEREAALAGQFDTALNNMPHGLCMFAPTAACGDESSLQRDDESVRRSRATRRQRADIIAPASRRHDLGGERQADPLGNREFAGERHHHHRSRRASGRSLSWTFQPMAGGGTVVLLEDITERRNAEARSAIWRATTN
jgi:hypothetical protein